MTPADYLALRARLLASKGATLVLVPHDDVTTSQPTLGETLLQIAAAPTPEEELARDLDAVFGAT